MLVMLIGTTIKLFKLRWNISDVSMVLNVVVVCSIARIHILIVADGDFSH